MDQPKRSFNLKSFRRHKKSQNQEPDNDNGTDKEQESEKKSEQDFQCLTFAFIAFIGVV